MENVTETAQLCLVDQTLQHCSNWCGKQGKEQALGGSWYWVTWYITSLRQFTGSILSAISLLSYSLKNGLVTWPRIKEYRFWVPCERQAGWRTGLSSHFRLVPSLRRAPDRLSVRTRKPSRGQTDFHWIVGGWPSADSGFIYISK